LEDLIALISEQRELLGMKLKSH